MVCYMDKLFVIRTPASEQSGGAVIDAGRSTVEELGPGLVREIFRRMATIRRFEERVEAAHQEGRLYGPFHSSVGQEAVAVGACIALRPDDVITSTHRGHGHVIAKGGDLRRMCAELWGRATGYCKGKGGSMHLVCADRGVLGQNGIVGASFFLGAGAGLAFQLHGADRVAVAFAGDGQVGQGVFHETLNLAAIWRLPVVFLVENNGFAHSFPASRLQLGGSIADRAGGFGIPSARVDGTDVLAVHDAVLQAARLARRGGGPSLVEAVCYRWRGHNLGDADHRYRDRGEVQRARANDPIELFRKEAIAVVDETVLAATDAEAAGAVDDAIRFAEASPPADPRLALEDIP
jgi:acetoin:2,6-dichlorophenolindophenol oxidoreductase subunit alpha